MRKVFVWGSKKLSAYEARLSYVGLLVALVFHVFSVQPSLLPRPWFFQSIISGVSFVIGYGLGVLIDVFLNRINFPRPNLALRRRVKKYTYVMGSIIFVLMIIWSFDWQNEIFGLMKMPYQHPGNIVTIIVLQVLIFAGLLGLGRSLRRIGRFLSGKLNKYVPRWISALLSTAVMAYVLVLILNGFLYSSFIRLANNHYANFNKTSPSGVTQPTSEYRSGSPNSHIAWTSMGYRGQEFIGNGPTVEQISKFVGHEAKEPIRIYSGLGSADTIAQRAKLAVDELKRTDAKSRAVWVVATTTGSGWIEREAPGSLEYMQGGDTAFITQQYSPLPSWISFLVDQTNATDTGQVLFDSVYDYWSTLPVESRPKLYVYGLSLGSYGGQAAFATANDLSKSVDGAMLVGTPSFTPLWQRLNNERDSHSPMWQPTVASLPNFHWASTPADIERKTFSDDARTGGRILYLQHASDAVVWWNPSLIFHKPDWLRETRGPDVSPSVRWYPIVTFIQTSIDQMYSVNVPVGNGHNYANTMVPAWQALTNPADWSAEKTAELQAIILDRQ